MVCQQHQSYSVDSERDLHFGDIVNPFQEDWLMIMMSNSFVIVLNSYYCQRIVIAVINIWIGDKCKNQLFIA